MTQNWNHFICPRCSHDFYAQNISVTCDGCGLKFDISSSRTCRIPRSTKNIIAPEIKKEK
jgi:Zn finger protein HypA/HybF involved in hydrogenase expression